MIIPGQISLAGEHSHVSMHSLSNKKPGMGALSNPAAQSWFIGTFVNYLIFSDEVIAEVVVKGRRIRKTLHTFYFNAYIIFVLHYT